MTAPQMCLRTITASSLCQHLSTEELRYQHYQSGLKQGPGVGAASSVPEPSLALAPAPVAVAAPAVATATAAAGTAPEAPTAVAEGATSRGPAPASMPAQGSSKHASVNISEVRPAIILGAHIQQWYVHGSHCKFCNSQCAAADHITLSENAAPAQRLQRMRHARTASWCSAPLLLC